MALDRYDTTHLRDDLPFAQWAEDARREREERDRRGRIAMAKARENIRAAVLGCTEQVINARVKRFRRSPLLLNNIRGLDAFLHPRALRARAEALLEQERSTPRRWRGFGGESPEITLLAVIRYAEQELAESEASFGDVPFATAAE